MVQARERLIGVRIVREGERQRQQNFFLSTGAPTRWLRRKQKEVFYGSLWKFFRCLMTNELWVASRLAWLSLLTGDIRYCIDHFQDWNRRLFLSLIEVRFISKPTSIQWVIRWVFSELAMTILHQVYKMWCEILIAGRVKFILWSEDKSRNRRYAFCTISKKTMFNRVTIYIVGKISNWSQGSLSVSMKSHQRPLYWPWMNSGTSVWWHSSDSRKNCSYGEPYMSRVALFSIGWKSPELVLPTRESQSAETIQNARFLLRIANDSPSVIPEVLGDELNDFARLCCTKRHEFWLEKFNEYPTHGPVLEAGKFQLICSSSVSLKWISFFCSGASDVSERLSTEDSLGTASTEQWRQSARIRKSNRRTGREANLRDMFGSATENRFPMRSSSMWRMFQKAENLPLVSKKHSFKNSSVLELKNNEQQWGFSIGDVMLSNMTFRNPKGETETLYYLRTERGSSRKQD